MGGMQTRSIAPNHLDIFAYIGVFSGGSIAPTDVKDMDSYKQKVKLVFVSYGSRAVEPAGRRGGGARGGPFGGDPKAATEALPEPPKRQHALLHLPADRPRMAILAEKPARIRSASVQRLGS